jgi:hypothetical protein
VAFTATIRVTGVGRLADFRERLRQLMVRDIDSEEYTEHHTDAALEYRMEPKLGLPFPVFVEASGEFAELRIEAEWQHDKVRGRVVIEAGKLVERSIEKEDG